MSSNVTNAHWSQFLWTRAPWEWGWEQFAQGPIWEALLNQVALWPSAQDGNAFAPGHNIQNGELAIAQQDRSCGWAAGWVQGEFALQPLNLGPPICIFFSSSFPLFLHPCVCFVRVEGLSFRFCPWPSKTFVWSCWESPSRGKRVLNTHSLRYNCS